MVIGNKNATWIVVEPFNAERISGENDIMMNEQIVARLVVA